MDYNIEPTILDGLNYSIWASKIKLKLGYAKRERVDLFGSSYLWQDWRLYSSP